MALNSTRRISGLLSHWLQPKDGSPQAATAQNLFIRVISALILAPLAIFLAYVGGWSFTLFWTVAAFAVWWEWVRLVDPADNHGVLVTGWCTLTLQALLASIEHVEMALPILVLGILAISVIAARHALWMGAGITYASMLLLSPVAIRNFTQSGFETMVFLFAVVWITDIAGYFAGRAFGGPKLAPSISPKKTWSGAIAGAIGAMLAGAGIIAYASGGILQAVIFALFLSIAAQGGDLLESKIKRHFNAKDSSALIPGHGGVMDRLDGFVVAAFVWVLVAALRGQIDMSGPSIW